MTMWPVLPYDEWRETLETLHRWTQIIGKVQLALTPTTNHFWNAALAVTPRGLTTAAMPFDGDALDIAFDFLDHTLAFRTSRGESRVLPLEPNPVADFHRDVFATLRALGVGVSIWEKPVELLEEAISFPEDRQHRAYDAGAAQRFARVVLSSALVLEEFRARFTGKCSPVQFFWGTFDLAVSRFSGRAAPPRPGADPITREAYADEVSSAGFWPGDSHTPMPAFYAYTAPVPAGIERARILPPAATWDAARGEFLLPYDAVRLSTAPRTMLAEFFQSTYEAGARLAGWDRSALERPVPDRRRVPVRGGAARRVVPPPPAPPPTGEE